MLDKIGEHPLPFAEIDERAVADLDLENLSSIDRAAVSATMALRFEMAFGLSADTLLEMQVGHESRASAAEREGTDVQRLAVV